VTAKREVVVYRGTKEGGAYKSYAVDEDEGMVVLDAVHRIQAADATDLACRWNCKAGKCGSCSAEINGKSRLMCMTRMDDLPEGPIHVAPIKTFPLIKDLVTDVSWNFRVKKRITPFTPTENLSRAEREKGEFNMQQVDIDRIQEFRKCIECFMCQNVCHVLRDHDGHEMFDGPRFMIHLANLEMHPKDTADRIPYVKETGNVGACNITKCCTEVCPEHIKITDNGIIPLKERMATRYYDPIAMVWRKLTGAKRRS
jgi:succinate dehydrogenase / fumarate reductase, iron-sulfur subunit